MNVIGKDSKGNELKVGDKCSFIVKLSRPTNKLILTKTGGFVTYDKVYEEKEEKMEGVIVYDEDSFSYAFSIDDYYCPLLLMSVVEYGTIEKVL